MRFRSHTGSVLFQPGTLLVGGLVLLAVSACGITDLLTSPVENRTCPDVGWVTMVAEVRDQAGRPAAQGASLILTEGSYLSESPVPQPVAHPLLLFSESSSRPGRYVVKVTRPYYETGVISRVTVPGGCRAGKPPIVARVTIRLKSDAPAIRALMAYHPNGIADRIPGPIQLGYQLDADPGIVQSVRWESSDPSAVTVTANGVAAPGCGTGYRGATITATSVAKPTLSSSLWVTTAVSGTGSCGGG